MNEDYISEIMGDAEAIKVLVDDMSIDMPLKDQHRLQAIYVLAEDQLRKIGCLDLCD